MGWDFAGAEPEFQRALALAPSDASTHGAYGWCLTVLGKYPDALAQYQQAHELDPLSPKTLTDIGDLYSVSRQYQQALDYYQQAIQLAPDFWWGYFNRALIRWYEGDVKAAIPDAEKAVVLADNFPLTEGVLGQLYGISGRRADALKILDRLKEQAGHRYVTPAAFVGVYAGLGDNDRAFQWLEKLYEERSDFLLWLKQPIWDGVRSDPRFQAIYKKVGLPP